MIYYRPATERGTADFGWLQSRHSFSFGRYYDPKHNGFSVLRVINDDRVKPAYGFDTHGHKDMEIISYVVSGALKHKDSAGNEAVIPAGDIQRMSAGTGIMHSEFNASDSDDVHFLQIWVMPHQTGITPSYAQKTIHQEQALTPIVTPTGSDTAISVNQDLILSRLVLQKGEQLQLPLGQRAGYLQVVRGHAITPQLAETGMLAAGDGVGLIDEPDLQLTAGEAFEALWFDMPRP